MKYLFVIIFLSLLFSSAQSQSVDSLAQANGWTKIQLFQRSGLDKDSIQYIDFDKESILKETTRRLIFWVRFYDKNANLIEQRTLDINANTLFNYNWTTFPPTKKAFLLNKWGLTDVGY